MQNSLLALLLSAWGVTTALGQSKAVLVEWNPNTETNLIGYVVMVGTNSGFSTNGGAVFTSPLTTNTTWTVPNLEPGRVWHFSVLARAVEASDDSLPSLEVSWPSKLSRPSGLTRRVTVTVDVEFPK